MHDSTHPTSHTPRSIPRHGTRAYREAKHGEYVGPLAFELGTDFARVAVQGLTALAHMTPLEKAALDETHQLVMHMDAFKDAPAREDEKYSGKVFTRRLTKAQLDTCAPGLTRGLAIWTTDVMGTPLLKKDGYAPDQWPLVIPDDLYDELHTKDDPYWWMDAVVGLVLAHALMAHRDMERTPERDGVVYDFVGMPKRALFVLCRDYNNPATRERWAEVREMASRIFFRGAPLIRRREDIACDHLDASRLGPFNRHALEAWVVSRHVLENANKVDEALARRETRRAYLRARLDEQGKQATPVQEDDLPTHPDRTRAPSSRGAARVTPDIFLGTLLDMPVQLAVQVHFRFNRSNGRTLTLEQIEVSCGRAMWRKRRRPRPSRRKGRVEKVIKAGIRRGLWSQRRDPGTGQAQPILVRATLRAQHASYRVLVDPGRPPGSVTRSG